MKLNEVFAKKTYRHRLKTISAAGLGRRISVQTGKETLWTDTKTLEDYLAQLIVATNIPAPDRACYFIYEGLFRDMRRSDLIARRYRHRWNQEERRERVEGWFTNLLAKRSDDSLLRYDADDEEDYNLIVTIHSSDPDEMNEGIAKKTYRIRQPEIISALKAERKQIKSSDTRKQVTKEIKRLRQKHLKAAPGLKVVKEILAEWKKIAKASDELYRNSIGTKIRRGGHAIHSHGYIKLKRTLPNSNEYFDVARAILENYGHTIDDSYQSGMPNWIGFRDGYTVTATIYGNEVSDRDFYTDRKIKRHKFELGVNVHDYFEDHPDLEWQ